MVGSRPLLFVLVPALSHFALLGVPLAAWLVAAPAFPVFVVIGAVYERRANALDESFRDLIRGE
jgi:putative solute:sodium symporter small subunit